MAIHQDSFRRSPIWYVSADTDPLVSPAPFSAKTLDPLRVQVAEDYSDYAYARETWEGHPYWFTGLGFRVYTPLTVIVIQNSLTPAGLIKKPVRQLIQRIRGRWEITRNGKDIQGFLTYPDHIRIRLGMFRDHRAEYLRCFRNASTLHAACEDYRAAASIDLEHDQADLNRKVAAPLLALWGERGPMHRMFDMLSVWRERADDVRGKPIPSGHFLAEEAPEPTLAELQAFLRS